MIAFLDANALTYLTEGEEPFAGRARDALRALESEYSSISTSVSRLSWLECRVGPMKTGNTILLKRYDGLFALPDLITIELTPTVVELATYIRAQHSLKTPDCLQAACCLQLGADHVFITGDAVIKRFARLNVRLLV